MVLDAENHWQSSDIAGIRGLVRCRTRSVDVAQLDQRGHYGGLGYVALACLVAHECAPQYRHSWMMCAPRCPHRCCRYGVDSSTTRRLSRDLHVASHMGPRTTSASVSTMDTARCRGLVIVQAPQRRSPTTAGHARCARAPVVACLRTQSGCRVDVSTRQRARVRLSHGSGQRAPPARPWCSVSQAPTTVESIDLSLRGPWSYSSTFLTLLTDRIGVRSIGFDQVAASCARAGVRLDSPTAQPHVLAADQETAQEHALGPLRVLTPPVPRWWLWNLYRGTRERRRNDVASDAHTGRTERPVRHPMIHTTPTCTLARRSPERERAARIAWHRDRQQYRLHRGEAHHVTSSAW